jgi:hypothetical protein
MPLLCGCHSDGSGEDQVDAAVLSELLSQGATELLFGEISDAGPLKNEAVVSLRILAGVGDAENRAAMVAAGAAGALTATLCSDTSGESHEDLSEVIVSLLRDDAGAALLAARFSVQALGTATSYLQGARILSFISNLATYRGSNGAARCEALRAAGAIEALSTILKQGTELQVMDASEFIT